MGGATSFGRMLWSRHRLQRYKHDIVGEFISINGAEVRVLVAREAGASSRVLVLVPDPPNVIEHYLPLIQEMAKEATVISFEMPGFGYSYTDPGFHFDIASQTATIEALFQYLSVHDAVLDMSCLGAYVGLNYARAYSNRIHRIMLQQVPSFGQAQAWARRADLKGMIRTPWIGQLFMRTMNRKVAAHWYHSALPDGHSEQTYRNFAAPALSSLACGACFFLGDAYQALLSEANFNPAGLRQEITLVWGAADPTHALSNSNSLLEQLPHVRLVEFPTCGHFPALEAPEQYLRLLKESLG